MKKRLYFYSCLTIIVGLFAFFISSVLATTTGNLSAAKTKAEDITRICAALYTNASAPETFAAEVRNARVTIISSSGEIIADGADGAAVRDGDNHFDRPEIESALRGSPRTHIRYSETLGENMIYYALKVEVGDDYVFVRTAVPAGDGSFFSATALPLLTLAALTFFCFLFIRNVLNRVTKPLQYIEAKLAALAAGNTRNLPGGDCGYEDIAALSSLIDGAAGLLRDTSAALAGEKAKLDYIINNIGNSIIIVDEETKITLVNNSALSVFDVTASVVGKHITEIAGDSTLKALTDAVEDCISTKNSAIFEITITGKILLVTVKRLAKTPHTMAVLTDITESREHMKHREEFFANASHELKTPLTAIRGFSELAAISNKDETVAGHIGRIMRETERMSTLIGDMLKISELESAKKITRVPVSLLAVINEARDSLSAAIAEKQIDFNVFGDATVSAEQSHVYELVKNLAENAVRYNKDGGEVTVRIIAGKSPRMLVIDTGIGIPADEQARIFERFYRVEKSRSGLNGGTGLGLAIVKHVCALYNWNLSLKSKSGAGTTVIVDFLA